MDRSHTAHRALLHPLWLASLSVLVLNDHFLKGSGLLPGWLTGKLSDIAGLLVAPALLAVLLRLSSRRAILAAHLATGAVFAAIKLSPAAAAAFARLMELGPFHATIVADVTDLLALPALALSLAVLVPEMRRPAVDRPFTRRALVAGASLACAATSQRTEEPCVNDPTLCEAGTPREQAALVLGNTTTDKRLIRVRGLKDSVLADCDAMLVDPTHTLDRALFADAQTWLIEPKRGLPLQNRGECSAYLIDADGMPMTLVAFRESDFPTADLSTSTDEPDNGKMIGIQIDTTTGGLHLGTHPAVFAAPPFEQPAPSPACAPPDAAVGVAWSSPFPSTGLIQSITTSPDGCHAITMDNEGGSSVFYLCVPPDALPFKAGDAITIGLLTATTAFPESGGAGSVGTGLLVQSEGASLLVWRGNTVVRRSMAPGVEPMTDPGVSAGTAAGCLGSHDECGSLVEPLDVSITGDHVPDTIETLRAGQSLALADGYGTLYLLRAEQMPIRDSACPPATTEERHFESVLVITPPAGN
ncbi:MAG: hypothetical protein U0359_03920 [Byssovorax sp.]